MEIRKFLFVFFLLANITGSDGQTPYFQRYSLLKKSETVQVNKIFQDHTGLIWYATSKGLFNFDGLKQKRFTTKDSLRDDQVTALAEDSLGRLWIGYNNGTLSYLDKGKFHDFNPEEGSASQPISDILFDRMGTLWYATYNDGLYYYLKDRLYRLDETDGMPDLFIYDIIEDREGRIWAGTDGGAVICVLKNNKADIKVIDYKSGLPDNIVKKFSIAEDGSVWMATEDGGLVNFDIRTGKAKGLTADAWDHGSVTDFVIKRNTFWISTVRKGLIVYHQPSGALKFLDANAGNDFNSITTLFKDVEENIWAGTKSGIMRTAGNSLTYMEDRDLGGHTNVLALAVDQQDNLWFSTSEGLFKRSLSNSSGIFAPLEQTPFQQWRVISLYVDSFGYLWAGLYGEGVLRIDPVNGHVRYIQKELRNGNVLNITGRGNVVWLATLGGGTRVTLDGENLAFRNFTSADGLSSDYIYQIFVDSRGKTWFATDGSGVDMLDDKGFHHYENGLASKVVFGFAEDAGHSIWVNVQGDGLFQIVDENFKLPDFQLRNNNIACLAADPEGNLVVADELGIDIYIVKKKVLVSKGEEAGIKNRQANLNAFAKDGYGNLYIGTDDGIIKYAFETFEDMPGPKPIIKGLKVLNKNVDPGNHIFTYDHNSINIEYTGYWFQNPENLNFRYKLDQYDLDWIYSHDRNATYSSLPPGEYVFRLAVSDTDDFHLAKEATFAFTIKPPFWQTNLFYVLSVIALVVLVYAFIKFSEKKLKRDNAILETKVHERTLEIQRQKEEIQAQNEEILTQAEEIQGINENLELLVKERTFELEKKNKALEEYAFINAHQLRAPVASILGLINLFVKSESPDESEKVKAHLKESAERLNDIVRSITKAIERGD